MTIFNPNDPGIANGNYFGLPYTAGDAEIILISVPWDATTSYRPGTSKGPEAMLSASLQIDLFDPVVTKAWETRIGTIPIDPHISKANRDARKHAEKVISHLENGGNPKDVHVSLEKVNLASEKLNSSVFDMCSKEIAKGKTVGIVGGDHSVPFGLMKAIGACTDDFGILHIDAHADLRKAYEGFNCSHASIMFNALNDIGQISQLTQVAVRDFSQGEADYIDSEPRIRCFTDFELKKNAFEGKTWKSQCEDIICTLPKNVYISFDIDGLTPDLSPGTGTPVPGGLSFREADYLLYLLSVSNKKIVGFDLCEVSPSDNDEWDSNVGARMLFKLCLYTKLNRIK